MNICNAIPQCIFRNCLYLSAEQVQFLYLSLLNIFGDSITVGIKAILSKNVDPGELGKVFACHGFVFSFVGVISPTANYIYAVTVSWHAGFIYCLGNIFYIIMALLSIAIFFQLRRSRKLMLSTNETDDLKKYWNHGQ